MLPDHVHTRISIPPKFSVALSKVIGIDEDETGGHLDEMLQGTVAETPNALLDAKADEMCNAQHYDGSPDRIDTRAGYYKRKVHTKAGEV